MKRLNYISSFAGIVLFGLGIFMFVFSATLYSTVPNDKLQELMYSGGILALLGVTFAIIAKGSSIRVERLELQKKLEQNQNSK